ncbi:MAG: hypothetical protein COY19_05830 [Candidatus Marinimicrobia bacterium CG_4_10_14_0_2_um_filter_48_9]|nr:MAG: hypothetical protein COY19_05830 [Candidatus Marinimicrobia bacterium CG_4_10_14_0_2_um_filter_48_9]
MALIIRQKFVSSLSLGKKSRLGILRRKPNRIYSKFTVGTSVNSVILEKHSHMKDARDEQMISVKTVQRQVNKGAF